MRKFAEAVVPVLAVVTLIIIGHPGSMWAQAVKPNAISVPEIDPSSGVAAMALLAGTIAVIRGWRTR